MTFAASNAGRDRGTGVRGARAEAARIADHVRLSLMSRDQAVCRHTKVPVVMNILPYVATRCLMKYEIQGEQYLEDGAGMTAAG